MPTSLVLRAGPLVLLTACANLPTSFPPDAQPISARELETRLAGTSYVAKSPGWRINYGAQGQMELTLNNGQSAKGRWRAEDSRLCIDFENTFPSGCSEMRAGHGKLYLRRNVNREVVVLTPQP